MVIFLTPTSLLCGHTGEELHGVVYPPVGLEEGKKYPTVLYTYGGPVVQVIVCMCVCVCGGGGGGGGGSSWVRIIRNVLPIYLIPIYSWYLPLLPCVLCSAQLVTREFSRHLPRIQAWVRHGFAVVMVDNRGSANRGTKFEAHIQACCVYITKYPRVHAATIFVWY